MKTLRPYYIGGILLFLILFLIASQRTKKEEVSGQLIATVKRDNLVVELSAVGELDAADSHMVSSDLHGNKGKIIYLVPDGSHVEKGSVLVHLDPTPFEEEVQQLQAKVDSLKAAVDAAKQLVAWEKNQMEQAVAAREYDAQVAELELDRLVKGEGPLQLAEYQEKAEKAKAEKERYASFARELEELEKQGFKNPAEITRARENAVIYSDNYLAAQRRLTSYKDFVFPSMVEAGKAKVRNSRLILEQNQNAAVFKVANAVAELDKISIALAAAESSLALARQELQKTEILAPSAGIAILYEAFRDGQKRKPREGDIVIQNQPILYLPDTSRFIAKTRVREVDLYKVKVGQSASVRIDAYPLLDFQATVVSVDALAAEERHDQDGGKYFQVTLSLSGQDERLRPGMTARVEITAEHAENALLLPVQAIFREPGGEAYVYRQTLSGVDKTSVKTGRENELLVELLSGLEEGDKVHLVPPESEEGIR